MYLTAFTPKLISVLKQGYTGHHLRSDISAGLTVAIVALPLTMALAVASGASPDKGLITAILAGFLMACLGGSRVQIGGPTGAFVVVIFNIIAQYGYQDLILTTFMASIILIVAGYLKFGETIKFIPQPVVVGFTAGIAVIIASSQIKDFLGLNIKEIPADFITQWTVYCKNLHTAHVHNAFIGLETLIVILVLRYLKPKWPIHLLAIIISVLSAMVLNISVETIGSRFPEISARLPIFEWPHWTFVKIQQLLPSAFTVAFLAGIEALLSAMVADSMTGFKHRPNQELVGLGIANMGSACFGGLPATGAIARTATNIKAGGQTPIAGILHAVFLLLFALLGMNTIKMIPLATLAAILLVVAWDMSEITHFFYILKISIHDRIILLLTFFLTIFIDISMAIGVGVILSSLFFMHQMSRVLQISSKNSVAVDLEDDQESDEKLGDPLPEGIEVFWLNGPFFFGVTTKLMEAFKTINEMPKVLILQMAEVPYLDTTGISTLQDIVDTCKAKGSQVILSAPAKQPKQLLEKTILRIKKQDLACVKNYDQAIKLALKVAQNK